jgi:uncharacterized spore protein YtfJ
MDVANLLAKASDGLSVSRAFGTAYEKNGTLIIPVALVAGGGGGGTSGPRAATSDARTDPPAAPGATRQPSERMDAGGGFGGLVLPVGAYIVKGDQVRWVSAIDTTIVVLASLSVARMLTRAWTRRRRG